MKWTVRLGVALLLLPLLAPAAAAGDELRMMGLYCDASGDKAAMITVNMHGHVTRYDLSGEAFDPDNPASAWATRNQVFFATQQAGYLPEGAPTPFLTWPTAFTYSYGSFDGQWDYRLEMEGDALRLTAHGSNGVDLNVDALIHPAIMGQAQAVIAKYGIDAWDGFDQRDDSVLDGYGFNLSYERGTADHPSCEASGYMLYPDRYDAAHAALVKFLERILASL